MRVATGLASAAGFTSVMRSLLFGISPVDPVTFVTMAVVRIATAALAGYLPVCRALGLIRLRR